MTGEDDAQAELLRKFEAAVSGAEMADLRELAGSMSLLLDRSLPRPIRPELRRPPRAETALYRVRVDLDHAEPAIWRRLDLRCDLTLDVVHQVLQSAFDWTDSHLHRFALGGELFDSHSQLFLCPYDVDEGEPDDDGGIPASAVRLDETLQDPGDVLRYLYDYGDSWELTLRLEEVLPAAGDAPTATCVDGRRAAPPEDCGGITDAGDLAEVLDDPARFDLDELNRALREPYFVLREYGVDPRLVDLVNRLRYTSVGDDLAARTLTLVSAPTELPAEELQDALAAHRWFLDRAHGGGIELTSAGYLKPADVEAASRVLPTMGDWIGRHNRESHTAPVLQFRESLQSMGLLRKRKGTLLLTRAGAAAQRDPCRLWQHLASRLVPDRPGRFEAVAGLLLLAYAASGADAPIPREQVAAALSELGWHHRDGRQLEGYEIYRLDVFHTLVNVSDQRVEHGRNRVSPAAAALARAALRQ